MYVVIGLATPCWLRRLFNREAPWFYAATGAVAGSMIIIEAPARHLGKKNNTWMMCHLSLLKHLMVRTCTLLLTESNGIIVENRHQEWLG
jgi:hypothetical protein